MNDIRSRLPALLLALGLVAASGCSPPKPAISDAIAKQFQQSKGDSVDLATAHPGDWERVCIFGPRAGEKAFRTSLGFEWNAAQRTHINTDDGIALLVFVKRGEVEDFVEHPRNQGDFASMSGQCFAPEKARFYQAPASQTRPGGMYPKSEL